jgi:hypothetical protein
MPGKRTDHLLWLGLLLIASSLLGCSSPPPDDQPPTPGEVRKQLAKSLKGQERGNPLVLDDLHEEGEGRYTGTATGNSGGVIYTYAIDAQVDKRWLHYTAKGSTLLGDGPIFSGVVPLPLPPFRERHAELMQWLRAIACVVQGLAVVWAVLGRFGLRRLYSPRMERVLVISAAFNLAFALMWGYEFFWGPIEFDRLVR